jgi:hypothetical protein
MDGRTGGRLREESVKVAKVLLKLSKMARVGVRGCVVDGECELRFFMPELGFKDLACAGDCVALVVEEAFNSEGHLDIAAAIEALAGSAFVRLELREFALPEAEDVGRNVAESSDFADAEVEFVRDVRPGWGSGFADWLMLCHAIDSDTPPAIAARLHVSIGQRIRSGL